MRGKYLGIKYKHWRDYIVKEMPATGGDAGKEIDDVVADESGSSVDPSQQNFAVKVAFLVGQTLNNETQQRIVAESDMYGDIIQESFIDSYNNLTLKTIMMLKWVNGTCCDKGKHLCERLYCVLFYVIFLLQ